MIQLFQFVITKLASEHNEVYVLSGEHEPRQRRGSGIINACQRIIDGRQPIVTYF